MSDKIRVMIVDDHDRVRDELVATLTRSEAVEVVGATGCADEASRLLAERHPDVILLDVKRRDGDGLTVCRRLSGNGNHHAVVVLTSYLSREEWHEARQAGAADYLLKQIDHRALLSKIAEVARVPSG